MNSNQVLNEIYEPEAYATGVGCRVVRGPDWKWNKQDGGEGHVGTVRRFDTPGEAIVVWDSGIVANYRCGVLGHDLRVLDSSPTGVKHPGTICEGCQESPIYGVRWKCAVCLCTDLCSGCYHGDKHTLTHHFLRITAQHKTRVIVGRRLKQRRVEALGLFPKARVVRGIDWSWDSQDCVSPIASTGGSSLLLGGSSHAISCHGVVRQNSEQLTTGPILLPTQGRITDRRDWYPWAPRSAALVAWDSGAYNVYRVGYTGLMDLKAIRSAKGGGYYVDHLPLLVDLREYTGGDISQRLDDMGPCAGEEETDQAQPDSSENVTIPNVTSLQDLEMRRRRTATVFNDSHIRQRSAGRYTCAREHESESTFQANRIRNVEVTVQSNDGTTPGRQEPAASSCLNVCTLASRLHVQPTPTVDCNQANTERCAQIARRTQGQASLRGTEVPDISPGRCTSTSGGGLRTFGQTARNLLTDLLRANSCASSTVTVQNRLPNHRRTSANSPPILRAIIRGTAVRSAVSAPTPDSRGADQDGGRRMNRPAFPRRPVHDEDRARALALLPCVSGNQQEAANLETSCSHMVSTNVIGIVDGSTVRRSVLPCSHRERVPRRMCELYNQTHEYTTDSLVDSSSPDGNFESISGEAEDQDGHRNLPHAFSNLTGEELIRAAEEGDVKRLKCLLQHRHVDVNVVYAGSAALHTACEAGHLACVALLLFFGANRLLRDGTGNQAVHSAAKGGNINVLQLILAPRSSLRIHHCNTDEPSADSYLQSLVGSSNCCDLTNDQTCYSVDLDDVPDINSRNALRQTALHLAVTRRDLAIAHCLLEDYNALSSLQDCDGDTPLHDAISSQDTHMVELLLKHSPDLTITNNSGQNPLHYATIQGEANIVRIILHHCLEQIPWLVDEPQSDGLTALHLAAYHGHLDVCDLLLQAGANANCTVRRPVGWLLPLPPPTMTMTTTTHGDCPTIAYTPLHLAVHKEHPDVLCALLCYGARATGRNADGISPMQLALTVLAAQAHETVQNTGQTPKRFEVAMVPFLASVARLLICMADSLVFAPGRSGSPLAIGASMASRRPSRSDPLIEQQLITIEDNPAAEEGVNGERGSISRADGRYSVRLTVKSPLSRRLKSTIQATLETGVPRSVLIAACLASAIGAEARLPGPPDTEDEAESNEPEGRAELTVDSFVTDVFSEGLDPVLQLALQQCHMESMNSVSSVRAQLLSVPDYNVRRNPRSSYNRIQPEVVGDAGLSDDENLVDILFQADDSVLDPVSLTPSAVSTGINQPMLDNRSQSVTVANAFTLTLNNATTFVHQSSSHRLLPPSMSEIDPEWRECLVCSENDRATVAVPCGHIITCGSCSSLVKKCLLCRQRITGFHQFTNCCECHQAHGVIVARPCNHMLWCKSCLEIKAVNLDAASAPLNYAGPLDRTNHMRFTSDTTCRENATGSEQTERLAAESTGEWREVPLSQLLSMINNLSTLLDDLVAGGLCMDGCAVCNSPVESIWPVIVLCAGVEYRSSTLPTVETDLIVNPVSGAASNSVEDQHVVGRSCGTRRMTFNRGDGDTNFSRRQLIENPREQSHDLHGHQPVTMTGALSREPITPNNHLHQTGTRGELPLRRCISQSRGKLCERELSKLKHELQVMREQIRCPICLDRSRNLVFMCGHATCQWCGDQVTSCPICRRSVESRIILY